jgi:hypothetical protein
VVTQHHDDFIYLLYNSLSKNKTIESLKITNSKSDFEDIKFLKFDFLVNNHSLKILDVSNVSFTEYQMISLKDSICKNNSITSLNFSNTNYKEDFDFLSKENLKSFQFLKMNEEISDRFLKGLQINKSLIFLKISCVFGDKLSSKVDEVVGNHPSLEEVILKEFKQCDLKLFLKNPNLKSLEFNSIKMENLNEIDMKSVSIENLNLKGCHIDFTKNFKFLENLFEIPTLNSLNISENELGKECLTFIISKLENNHKIERLTFFGSFINEGEIVEALKNSLTKNHHLKHLNASQRLNLKGIMKYSKPKNSTCVGILKCPWENQTLESIQGFYLTSDLKDFVLLNSPVKEILCDRPKYKLDLTHELKWNTQLIHIEDHVQVPLYFYYMERNKELASILKQFPKKILKINSFDVAFHFGRV